IQVFFSLFKTLVGSTVTVELKNDMAITGTLVSVDQFLNIKLDHISANTTLYPHMMTLKNCFIRGSVVRYVHIPSGAVNTQLLQDATRKELMGSAKPAEEQQQAAAATAAAGEIASQPAGVVA
ncbi:Sm-like ribonucleoprotein, partial [Ramicandelaber brevisporus]